MLCDKISLRFIAIVMVALNIYHVVGQAQGQGLGQCNAFVGQGIDLYGDDIYNIPNTSFDNSSNIV